MSSYVDSILGANEKVIVRERQHWFVWFPSLVWALILMAIISAVSLLLVPSTFGVSYFGLIFNIIPLWMFVRNFLNWMNEEYIVTSRRIIQTAGVVNKSVIDSSLEKINDVVLSQSVMGRIMDFGDLEILTGSEIGINKLHRIQSPVKFKVAMLDAKEAMRDLDDIDGHGQSTKPRAQRSIPDMLTELDELRKKGLITEAEFQEKRTRLVSQI
jgi:uncharacterized membrane protein YdbT with pleckstrin-like domain